MESGGEPTTSKTPSLRSIRIVAAVGALVAIAAVVLGFSTSLLYGFVALVALPAVPLLFVLAFEAIRGTSEPRRT
jgi:hypothetical protein